MCVEAVGGDKIIIGEGRVEGGVKRMFSFRRAGSYGDRRGKAESGGVVTVLVHPVR